MNHSTYPLRKQSVCRWENDTLAEALNDSKADNRLPGTERRELRGQQVQERAQADRHQKHDLPAALLGQLPSRDLSDDVAPEKRGQHQRLLALVPVVLGEVGVAVLVGHRDNRHRHVHSLGVSDGEAEEDQGRLNVTEAEALWKFTSN